MSRRRARRRPTSRKRGKGPDARTQTLDPTQESRGALGGARGARDRGGHGDLGALVTGRRGGWRRGPRALSRSGWRQASAPRVAAGRSRRADAVSARSLRHARQAADGRHREDRPLPRSDHRHSPGRRVLDAERQPPAAGAEEARAIGRSRRCSCRTPDVAFKILALNTEKAHNLREKSLETIRMARALAGRATRPRRATRSSSSSRRFLTLGVGYEQRPRFSGGAYQSILRRRTSSSTSRSPRHSRSASAAASAS